MELRQRKRIRLENRDYSHDGYYFITICVKDRWPILCSGIQYVPDTHEFPLSEVGMLVKQSIDRISSSYQNVRVDKYVIMPNHIHLNLVLDKCSEYAVHPSVQFATVSKIVQTTKGIVTKALGYSIWQKSFHDHIIRNESDYLRISEYIETNPAKWQEDIYYAVPKGEYLL